MSAIRDAIRGRRTRRTLEFQLLALLFLLAPAGCGTSKNRAEVEKLNTARQQAALTGVAQRVVYRDKDGTTVTAVVEPPAPGDPTERVTTTKSPAR